MTKPIKIIQGGCWGSEGKGAITGYLCNRDGVDINVRTGAPNAGHSVIFEGRKYKMQQIGCGWVNPNTQLVIGAGALLSPEILAREVAEVSAATGQDIRQRLKIDRRAALHLPTHTARSKASGRHHAIGATGEGCSESLVDRIKGRGDPDYRLFGDSAYAEDYDVCDTEAFLNWSWNEGASILLEGTQGQLLDLYLGPYPYTTHKQTGPAQWMLEAGLSPALPTEIWLVVRTFPIRVAGNSGPLPQEISWPELAREMNAQRAHHQLPALVREEAIREFESCVRAAALQYKVPEGSDGLDQHRWSPEQRHAFKEGLSEINRAALNVMTEQNRAEVSCIFEMTTVTRKLRRIARLDREALEVSCRQARPHHIALTFQNYLWPQHWFSKPLGREDPDEASFIRQVSEWCGAPVDLVSYGPEDSMVLDLR